MLATYTIVVRTFPLSEHLCWSRQGRAGRAAAGMQGSGDHEPTYVSLGEENYRHQDLGNHHLTLTSPLGRHSAVMQYECRGASAKTPSALIVQPDIIQDPGHDATLTHFSH